MEGDDMVVPLNEGSQSTPLDNSYVHVTSAVCPACHLNNLRSNKREGVIHCVMWGGCGYKETFLQYKTRLAEEEVLRSRIERALLVRQIMTDNGYFVKRVYLSGVDSSHQLDQGQLVEICLALEGYPLMVQQLVANRYLRLHLRRQLYFVLMRHAGYCRLESYDKWRESTRWTLGDYDLSPEHALPSNEMLRSSLLTLCEGCKRHMRCEISIDGKHHVPAGRDRCAYCKREVAQRYVESDFVSEGIAIEGITTAQNLQQEIPSGADFVFLVEYEGEHHANAIIVLSQAMNEFAGLAEELMATSLEVQALESELIEGLRVLHGLSNGQSLPIQLRGRRLLGNNGIVLSEEFPGYTKAVGDLGYLRSRRTVKCSASLDGQHQLDAKGRCTQCRRLPRR